MTAPNGDAAIADATRTLELLHAQADAVRGELSGLRSEMTRLQEELAGLRTTHLLEANGKLVEAAVHADTVAQTAASSLDELTRTTQHDPLTGAPNRVLMLDRVESAISMASRRQTHVGVMFLDLDRFKQINDTLGHAVGDQVLELAVRRLESVLRVSDSVGRLGGDEFVVLLAELSRVGDAELIAQKMLSVLAEPAQIGPHRLTLSASLGISAYPEDGDDATSLIDRADAAMYAAKKQGPGRYAVSSPGAKEAAVKIAAPVEPVAVPTRRADSALAEHEAHLKELLEANRQLVEAAHIAQTLQAHAEEAHRRQINFVAMAAHALRNPLSALRMANAMLMHPAADPSTRSANYQIIQRQSALIARLIDDLLDGSRVGSGQFRLRLGELRLDTIVAAAVDACRHAIDTKEQRLQLDLPDEAPLVEGDSQRLVQLFANLLNNASRRSPHGGRIALRMQTTDREVLVGVVNDGAGIAPEALPRIFDLFTLDTNVPIEEAGLGIGLAVVQELARAHGGTVSANSLGKDLGCEFVVRLPRPGQARAEGERPAG